MVPTGLTDEQRMIVELARELSAGELADRAFEWAGETPWSNLDLLADHGLLCLSLPEAYGGGGMGLLEDVLVVEAVGRVCPDTAWLLVLDSIAPLAVARFGTEAAKRRYLPPVCAGETTMAIAISEPEAGSDVAAMTTRIEPDGDAYSLTGEKTWVSAVPDSEAAVVWTRFPDGDIGSVVVDLDADGVEILTEYENMAGHVQTHFVMEDVRVPAEQLLVTDDSDWHAQLRQLNRERVVIAAWTLAAARCAIERALEYARTREQFGQPIGEFQGLRWKFADMVTRYEAGRSLLYRTVREAVAAGEPPDRLAASLTRLFASERTERIVSEALQTFGANGYQRGHPLEYLYRFVRSRRIGHGTDEILKDGIADRLFEEGLDE